MGPLKGVVDRAGDPITFPTARCLPSTPTWPEPYCGTCGCQCTREAPARLAACDCYCHEASRLWSPWMYE